MTLNEIAYQEAAPFGKQFDYPFLAMVKDKVQVWRARLLKDTLDKKPDDRKFFLQKIRVPLILDTAVCGSRFNCPIRRPANRLPRVIRANSTLFDYIGSTDFKNAFTYYEPGMEQYKNQGKYGKHIVGYRFIDQFVEVLHEMIPEILIVGIFEDPIAAWKYNDCADLPCHPEDYTYPISGDLLKDVLAYVRAELREVMKPDELDTDVNIDNGTVQDTGAASYSKDPRA